MTPALWSQAPVLRSALSRLHPSLHHSGPACQNASQRCQPALPPWHQNRTWILCPEITVINQSFWCQWRPSLYCVSFLGWMQSTWQASTQAVSLVPIQGSVIMYGHCCKCSFRGIYGVGFDTAYAYCVGRGPSSSICRSQIPPCCHAALTLRSTSLRSNGFGNTSQAPKFRASTQRCSSASLA